MDRYCRDFTAVTMESRRGWKAVSQLQDLHCTLRVTDEQHLRTVKAGERQCGNLRLIGRTQLVEIPYPHRILCTAYYHSAAVYVGDSKTFYLTSVCRREITDLPGLRHVPHFYLARRIA
jgi:hypothetical protein